MDDEDAEASDDGVDPEAEEDTYVLKMLYKGNLAEMNRRDERQRRTKAVTNPKHDFYRSTRCSTTAQD